MVDSNLSAQLEMFISLKGVPRHDVLSKSDPFVVVSQKDPMSGNYMEVGRTETVQNNESPTFAKRFLITYHFEECQVFKFDVYDSDSDSRDLAQHDYVGHYEVQLGELVTAPNQTMERQLTFHKVGMKHDTSITIKVEEIVHSNETVTLDLAGVKLPKMDMFGKSDAYVEILRQREDNSWVKVHTTEIVKKSLNPVWKRFTLPASQLCNGDHLRNIKFRVFDWDKNSAHDEIGELETNLKELLETRGYMGQLTMLKKGKTKKRGQIHFKSVVVQKHHSFMDFLKGGMQISLQVAIDFTGSNGNPAMPNSLHYMRGGPNQYVQAINTIGNIVKDYDHDQMFPVWGFGGKPRHGGKVSHCFDLNNGQEVHGVQGILNAYGNGINNTLLSGPTYFSEIIQTSMALADQPFTQDRQHYSILLILTDGVINDMKQTLEQVVRASGMPLSIIIVGVGNANFDQMDRLDGDDGILRDNRGNAAKRDIVQFVPYRDFVRQGHIQLSELAKHTLAEVPRQVLDFAKMYNVHPMGM